MASKEKLPVLLCLAVLLASLAVLALDFHPRQEVSEQRMRTFQRLVGGLGMGAVTTPAWNLMDFDPRLQSVDESQLRPLPGGYAYSPAGTSSVTCFTETLRLANN